MALDRTEQLLDAAIDGGEEERGALLEQIHPRLVLWAATRMGPALRARYEPEDVAQEVLLAVHQALDGFEGRGRPAFLGWIYKIGENRIRDLVDRIQAKKRKEEPLPPPLTRTSASQHAVRAEQIVRVRRALEDLKPEYQEVVRLRRLQELPTPEVARLMERSENAVRVLYCRALKALAARMDGDRGGASAEGER